MLKLRETWVKQQFVGGAKTPADYGEQIDGGVRMFVNEIQQAIAMHGEHLGVFASDGCGRAVSAIDKGKLADHIPALVFAEDNLFAIAGLHVHFHVAVAQDKDLTARIAVLEDHVAFLEIPAIHAPRQICALRIIQKLEDRDLPDHVHGRQHGSSVIQLRVTRSDCAAIGRFFQRP
jgi:hypothetical protein